MDELDPESGDAMDAILSNAANTMGKATDASVVVVASPHPLPLCTAADAQGSPIADEDMNTQNDSDVESQPEGGARKRRRSKQAWSMLPVHAPDPKVKIALSLYKVQQSIYLLDFQCVEVR